MKKYKTYTRYIWGGMVGVLLILLVVTVMKTIATSSNSPVAAAGNPADLHLSNYPSETGSTTAAATSSMAHSSGASSNSPGTAPTSIASPQGCGLSLSLSQGTKTSGHSQYTLIVANIGRQTCSNVSISAYYPAGSSFVGSSLAPSSSNYYWKIGNMEPGALRTFSFTITLADTDDSALQACATGDNAVDACANPGGKSAPAAENIASSAITLPSEASLSPLLVSTPRTHEEYGSWVWQSPIQMSAAYEQSVIQGARGNGINVLYVTIDDYLSIAALPSGEEKNTRLTQYSDALENFIIQAQAAGIEVDAEAGERDWGQNGDMTKPFAIIDYVKQFNAERSHSLRGLQFDVEPYLLPAYANNKASVLQNFVAFVDKSAARLGSSSLSFGIVIPHFYDDAQAWTPSFTYNNTTAFAFDHLLSILDRRPHSSLIVMAYRNTALGDDSTTALASYEVKKASEAGHSTHVIVAQETGNVEPSIVTFFGLSKNDYLEQMGLIHQTFDKYAGFGGIAVHYIDPFLQLK